MNDSIFKLQIIKNNSEYEDVAFKSDLLNLNYVFGSAFYIQHIELKQLLRFADDALPVSNKRIVFKHILSLMSSKLYLLARDHVLYFPIDMADEYTGVLKCILDEEEQLSIQFGVVEADGVGIDIKTLDPIGDLAKHFMPQTMLATCMMKDLQAAIVHNLLEMNKELVEHTDFILPS